MQDLKVVVKEIEGFCDTMEVRDYFIVRGGKLSIPEGHFYYWALNSILPSCRRSRGRSSSRTTGCPPTGRSSAPTRRGGSSCR
jgi:hypothetical protein